MAFWNRKKQSCDYCGCTDPEAFTHAAAFKRWHYNNPDAVRRAKDSGSSIGDSLDACDDCCNYFTCRVCHQRFPRPRNPNTEVIHPRDLDYWPSFLRCEPCRNLCDAGREHPPFVAAIARARALVAAAISTPTPTPPPPVAGALAIGTNQTGVPVTLSPEQRARHTYVIGKSGSGKTTLLKQLTLADITAGHGVAYLDPHGDAVWDLLGLIPEHRRGDVIYFAPARADCPGFNPLTAPGPPYKVRGDIVGTLRRFFESWGPQLEMQLDYALTLLLTDPTAPHCFADLKRIFLDEDYRADLVQHTTDDEARAFWRDTFPTLGKTAHLPVLNKLTAFLKSGSPLARLLSTTTNTLDVRGAMDTGKILLVNLSKGELGEDGAHLIGALLVTAFSQAALSRTDTAEHARRPFSLYVDEFQNFISDGFDTILSEARKYKLALTLAHQNTGQVPGALLDNITGNVATLIVFSVNADDAAYFSRNMARHIHTHRLTGEPLDPDAHLKPLAPRIVAGTAVYADGKQYQTRDAYDATEALSAELIKPTKDPNLTISDWPNTRAFQNLDIGRAFVRVGTASSTALVTVPAPITHPNEKTRAVILDQQTTAHETATSPAREKNRPHQMPQDERTPPETTEPLHQESTTFDVTASDAVHSPDDTATSTTEQRPTRRLPRPRRRA